MMRKVCKKHTCEGVPAACERYPVFYFVSYGRMSIVSAKMSTTQEGSTEE